METRSKVIIRRCDDYDPVAIGGIIKEGMEELDAVPTGKVLLKPNVVIAHPELFRMHSPARSFWMAPYGLPKSDRKVSKKLPWANDAASRSRRGGCSRMPATPRY